MQKAILRLVDKRTQSININRLLTDSVQDYLYKNFFENKVVTDEFLIKCIEKGIIEIMNKYNLRRVDTIFTNLEKKKVVKNEKKRD